MVSNESSLTRWFKITDEILNCLVTLEDTSVLFISHYILTMLISLLVYTALVSLSRSVVFIIIIVIVVVIIIIIIIIIIIMISLLLLSLLSLTLLLLLSLSSSSFSLSLSFSLPSSSLSLSLSFLLWALYLWFPLPPLSFYHQRYHNHQNSPKPLCIDFLANKLETDWTIEIHS